MIKKLTRAQLGKIYRSLDRFYGRASSGLEGLDAQNYKLLNLADASMVPGQYGAALKSYLALPERYIQRKLLSQIARAYYEIDEPHYALSYLQRVPTIKQNLEYYKFLITVYESLREYQNAVDAAEKAMQQKFFTVASSREKGELLYGLSANLQRVGEGARAEKYLKQTAKHIYTEEAAKYGYGILHYRMKNWSAGVRPLESAVRKHRQDARFISMVARCCMYDGQFEKAVKYYEKSLGLDYSHADRHMELAECFMSLGDITKALTHYEAAASRAGDQSSSYAIKLASAYEKAGEGVNDRYETQRMFERSYVVPDSLYGKHESNKYNWYATYYEELDIDENTIFYESMSGDKMADNPLALFEAIMADERFSSFTHIWSVHSTENVPQEYLKLHNVIFVKRSSKLYMKSLATAKYIICNSKLPGYFIRKPNQLYLNTWHGTAYKKLGVHTSKTIVGEGYTARNFLQASHILTPNQHMTNVQQDAYQIRGLYEGKIAETGYPRIDMTVNATSEMKTQLRKELGLAKDKPTVLYAPTWRSGNKFDIVRLERDLRSLSELDCNLIFMGHHIMQRIIQKIEGLEGVIFTDSLVNSNRLLPIADVLITDYSSIFYDFMVTDKPIVHYLYDIKKYAKKRGLYFETDKLPGEVVYISEELIDAVSRSIGKGYQNPTNYEKIKDEFCPHEDGAVSKRVIDWFFFGNEDKVKTVKPGKKQRRRLFVLGDTRRFEDIDENLLQSLTQSDTGWKNYVLSRSASNMYPDRITIAKRLSPHATMLGYVPNNGVTLNELIHRDIQSEASRDYRRCFGEVAFDEVINLDKASDYWAAFSKA